MAETQTKQAERSEALTRREPQRGQVQRWDPLFSGFMDTFEFMNRVSEEMDRTFDRLWRDAGLQPFRRSKAPQSLFERRTGQHVWTPPVEAFQKDDRFIVRAELPGMSKDDVEIELTDEALTIRGQRREERDEEHEGYYLSERDYGEFYRVIPLPEGVIGESAQATFRDGILEVTMQAAPASANRGRRIEIRDASEDKQKK